MGKSKLRGGAKAHRKRVANRNQIIHQKKLALTKQIIAQMNEKNRFPNFLLKWEKNWIPPRFHSAMN